MRNWNTLADEALILMSQSNHSAFDLMLLEHLDKLLRFPSFNEDVRKKRLRRLLAIRWTVLAQTSMDYTFNPQNPINCLYLEIAEKIAANDEAVCQILMPTVKKIIGTGFSPEDVVSASEEDGQFILPHFLTHVRGDALISLLDIYAFGKNNTDRLFPSQTPCKELFELTAEDRERIRNVAGEASQRYFETLEKIHRVRHEEKPSVGFALKALTIALLKSSKKEAGTEFVADILECQEPILKFYRIWNRLSDKIKNRIKDYRADGATFTLESYLLCLFVHAKERLAEIEISETEFKRVLSEKLVPCTEQISGQFDTLLKNNPDLLNIPLPGMEAVFETESLPDEEALRTLAEDFQREVRTRSPILGVHDARVDEYIPMVEILARTLHENTRSDDLTAFVPLVKNHEDLVQALHLLPSELWEDFFSVLDSEDAIKRIFIATDEMGNEDATATFCYLLKQLPPSEWKTFFDALYDNGLESLFDCFCLGFLFDELPEFQWPFLRDAVLRLIDCVFVDEDDIVHFLTGMSITQSEKIVSLFQHKFDMLLNNPWELGYFFSQMDERHWPKLYTLFRSVIHQVITHKLNFKLMFEPISLESRSLFLQTLFSDVDFLSDNPGVLFQLMRVTSLADWNRIFDALGPTRISKFIRCENTLIAFLTQFDDPDDRISCIQALDRYLPSLKIIPVQFCGLLRTFPECEAALLRIFKDQFLRLLSEYLLVFASDASLKPCVVKDIRKDFIFLSEKMLPFILSSQNISRHCDGFIKPGHQAPRKLFCDSVVLLCQQMKTIEDNVDSKCLSETDGCLQKLQLLDRFVKTEGSPNPATAKKLRKELIAYFGEDFFNKMMHDTHNFITVSGVGFFPERATKVKKPARVQAFRSQMSAPLKPMRPATAPQTTPSFVVRGARLFRHTNTAETVNNGVTVMPDAIRRVFPLLR
ncbi:MAG: hypothetical protein A3F13_04125 [Gammaproteobacteria bacterium RIFCSPHIGHO2_12_FULL_40_19]|nr:MAG: hypothetical protein A3F13_04125 [Gammaproteobacteria bacterium RIFCSPHIGHO2_12_FULL_40_19]